MVRRVVRFCGELAAGETDPKRSMGIGARQGKTSGDKGPCPLPPVQDGQGPRWLHGVPGPVLSGAHRRECSSNIRQVSR